MASRFDDTDEGLAAFSESLASASEALASFQDELEAGVAGAGEDAPAGDAATGRGARRASRAGGTRRGGRERGAISAGLGRAAGFAQRNVLGAFERGEAALPALGAAVTKVLAKFDFTGKTGPAVKAAELAGRRTLAVTQPFARAGIDISPEERRDILEFQEGLAEREVREQVAVSNLVNRRISAFSGPTSGAPGPGAAGFGAGGILLETNRKLDDILKAVRSAATGGAL